MRAINLPEKTALLAIVLAASCASDHHVSPWGQHSGPVFEAFLRRPDLEAELAAVDVETAQLALAKTDEIRAELPPRGSGRAAVVRGYAGLDGAGRAVHAVRVATSHGVVMALGPLELGDIDRRRATELVPSVALGDGASSLVVISGSDLNGDGALDVVVRNDAGVLEIWHVGELGGGPYSIRMAAPPTRGVDINGDGILDLWGQVPIEAGDPIAPKLTDVATFERGGYSNATVASREWHTREASKNSPTKVTDSIRLASSIERAWHRVLSGERSDGVFRDLKRELVPAALRVSFDVHVRTITSIAP